MHAALHSLFIGAWLQGEGCDDGATAEANGYRVIFGFPGAIMQKENMVHRDREGGREVCVIQNRKHV